MRKLMRQRLWLAISFGLLVLFALLTAVEDSRIGVWLDRPAHGITFWGFPNAPESPHAFLDAIEFMAGPVFTSAFTVGLSLLVWRRFGFWRCTLVPALFVANMAVVWVIRQWFVDYPSGHVARVACAAVMTCLLASPRLRPATLAAAVAATVLVALQRIASDSHTGTDVIGAALLGWGLGLLVFAPAEWLPRRFRR